MARLLSGMKDETGKIKSEGFCGSESGDRSLMEAIMYPSLNVNGIRSGWIGKQARTIIPAAATASIDIRLVKGNDPADMVQKVIDHVRGQGYHVVGEEPDQAVRVQEEEDNIYTVVLSVVREEGVQETPESGTYTYSEGEFAEYDYSLKGGYSDARALEVVRPGETIQILAGTHHPQWGRRLNHTGWPEKYGPRCLVRRVSGLDL